MIPFLSWLVGLFPAGFREQFGRDMVEQIGRDHARASARGRLTALGFTLATAFDLVRSSLAEHIRPTWVSGRQPRVARKGMGDVMKDWLNDLRYAIRALRRSPGFAAIAVCTLGLAIGANAGIFSVVDTVLLNPLPFPHADRLVYIAASAPGSDLPEEFGVSAEFVVQYGEQSGLLEDVAVVSSFTATLRVGDRVERPRMSTPTLSLFSTLEVEPLLGRLPVPEDESRVVVISHGMWMSWFGGDPSVIGRTIEAAGGDRTIVGVMKSDFWFPREGTLLWIPNPIRPEQITPGRFGLQMVARVAPGVRREALVEELGRLAKQLPERFGGSAGYARVIEQHRPIVRSLGQQLLGPASRPLWVLLGSMGIVLLIACANVASLFMVRAERRQRDLAVRRAIGAGRGQLIRLQMGEAVIIALLAGLLAVALARVTVPLFLAAGPPELPRIGDSGIGVATLVFTLAASLFSALLCGLIPAVRSSAPSLARLRDGGRGSTRRRHWGRDALVVAQTALALVLLIGSALLVRSFQALRNVDPGYETADIFTFQIAPEGPDLQDGPAYARFHLGFMERIAALPGVESVGIVENVPLNESTAGTRFLTESKAGDPDGGALGRFTWTAGDYFATMGIGVLRGRAFEQADHVSSPGNIIVSKSAADLFWPGQDPIGQRLQQQGRDTWDVVVGEVEDVLQNGFREAPEPLIYYPLVGPTPLAWAVTSPAYVVRTSRAARIAPDIRALVREVAPMAPMYREYTMAGLASDSMVQLSFTMLTLGIISLLALILGAIGLYGVLSYIVAERTQEIGVRMALGAEAARVRRMVVGQGVRVVMLGVVIGLATATGVTRVLGSLLFGVTAIDGITFLGMSVAMIGVGLVASYVPALRASSVDPIRSLQGS